MSDQVQCPNCGGYLSTLTKSYFFDKQSGEVVRNGIVPLLLTLINIFICFPIFISTKNEKLYFIFGLLGVITATIAFSSINNFRKADKTFCTEYKCQLCGYEWKQNAGEELPNATVRPELIAKGAARLKHLEEERKKEEERRRNED